VMTRFSAAVLFALALFTGGAAADDKADNKADIEKAKGLAGKYDVSGTNPDGSKYEGTVEIEHLKANSVTITWKIGKRTDVGRGKVNGDTVKVEYDGALNDKRDGQVEYTIKKGGVLDGTFREKGSKKKGTEELTPKK
jgi:hypothetical protein